MAPKPKFYAVKVGHNPGVYSSWPEVQAQTSGFSGAVHKGGFNTSAAAQAWIDGRPAPVPAASSPTKSAAKGRSDSKGKKRRLSDVSDESGWDVVYSDGASKSNGSPNAVAGVGVWWSPNDPRNIAERCPGRVPELQTNNRAELIAILRILETAPQSKRPLLIKTDSKYCRDCFQEWLPNWIKRNWRTSTGEPVKNAPLIRYLSAQFDARARRGQQVRLQYVKAHNGEEGNEGADAQANKGVLEAPMDEQDWAALEAKLKDELETEFSGSAQRPRPVPLEVADEDERGGVGVRDVKMRKTSAGTTQNPKSTSTTKPAKPISRPVAPQAPLDLPPKISASLSQITPEDYAEFADCVLNDDDLSAELSD
ncbi:ribonuclease H-like domain-containing protein [Mycena rosella]|uniref:ribonuclease H n=1 Tax=Mycena rosella TaxID=1033263 RepID=A0AAD7GEL1_MYCRO|nr:ribonuclease H-like domain-containing protein [Mycena rosella]